jgi:hypothetical protein
MPGGRRGRHLGGSAGRPAGRPAGRGRSPIHRGRRLRPALDEIDLILAEPVTDLGALERLGEFLEPGVATDVLAVDDEALQILEGAPVIVGETVEEGAKEFGIFQEFLDLVQVAGVPQAGREEALGVLEGADVDEPVGRRPLPRALDVPPLGAQGGGEEEGGQEEGRREG